MSTLINALPRKLMIIKWTHICLMSTLINTLPKKTHDIKWTHICLMSTLINALPRKLVMLNGRIFAECQLNQCSAPKTRDIKWRTFP